MNWIFLIFICLFFVSCNEAVINYKSGHPLSFNLPAAVPTSLTLSSPGYSPSLEVKPTITVDGIHSGHMVKIFTDSSCTTEVAHGTSTGTSITLSTSELASGSYSFYALSIGLDGISSNCSVAKVDYEVLACTVNYVAVLKNESVGTTGDFCIMKYEARALKNDTDTLVSSGCGNPPSCSTVNWASIYHPVSNTTGYRPVSVPDGMPWRKVDQTSALQACSNLGTAYSLPSNDEWMTLARSVELVPENWSGGVLGQGILANGYTNSGNTAPASSSLDSCMYNTGVDTCNATGSVANRRTLFIRKNSTDVIWDISSNLFEWTNWFVSPANKAFQSGTSIATDQFWKDWKLIDTNIGENTSDVMLPITWASSFIWDFDQNDVSNSAIPCSMGIGCYYAGTNLTGGAALRGTGWNYPDHAGPFALFVFGSNAYSRINVGFRCVYRPQ